MTSVLLFSFPTVALQPRAHPEPHFVDRAMLLSGRCSTESLLNVGCGRVLYDLPATTEAHAQGGPDVQ